MYFQTRKSLIKYLLKGLSSPPFFWSSINQWTLLVLFRSLFSIRLYLLYFHARSSPNIHYEQWPQPKWRYKSILTDWWKYNSCSLDNPYVGDFVSWAIWEALPDTNDSQTAQICQAGRKSNSTVSSLLYPFATLIHFLTWRQTSEHWEVLSLPQLRFRAAWWLGGELAEMELHLCKSSSLDACGIKSDWRKKRTYRVLGWTFAAHHEHSWVHIRKYIPMCRIWYHRWEANYLHMIPQFADIIQ